jgi:ADP-ribose pyrophosphatase YjhB (NUDIX family)
VVVDARGRILLVRRKHEPLLGEWTIPGGRVRRGETDRAAVRRELFEETRLTVRVLARLEVVTIPLATPPRHTRTHRGARAGFVVVEFLCTPAGTSTGTRADDGAVRAASDAADAMWARPSDLVRLGVRPLARGVIRRALSRFRSFAPHPRPQKRARAAR